MYYCSKCNLSVIVFDEFGKILEKPIRACKCNAPILMDMSATSKSKTTVKG